MITLKNITLKNFMSVGQVTQAVNFTDAGLTLVLGNNLDLGGDGSRNGTGKTTILNSLSYGLYGDAISNIKRDHLINKTNNKGMMVTVEFEKDGVDYRIERGRKPNVFKFIVNDQRNDDDATDDGQGEGKLTQEEINKILGMGHVMFKHTVALNTYTEPFLSMNAADQRNLIEQLLGMTMLSDKATVLKELIKSTKEGIKEEEYKNKGIEDANTAITNSVTSMETKQQVWKKNKESSITELQQSLSVLQELDIDDELKSHDAVVAYNAADSSIRQFNKDIKQLETTKTTEESRLVRYYEELVSLQNNECHTCGQSLKEGKHKELLDTKESAINNLVTTITELEEAIAILVDSVSSTVIADSKPSTFYNKIAEAHDHKNKIAKVEMQIEVKTQESDPYTEQIETLRTEGIQEMSWDRMNDLTSLLNHQDFLLKLLTNKDSFIRKRIIEQNLGYLNSRLAHYLELLGLPHEVTFQSDLSVEIMELGRGLDFDNLSRGERNRLILGLSWSFRDVFESMNAPINFLAVDELVDSGLDTNGVEAAMRILKDMGRSNNKNVFLISHRDELVGRVGHTLQVIKENGFTSFSTGSDYVQV
jgi:DNA repair exonuclease SbcCD ATPase subunit